MRARWRSVVLPPTCRSGHVRSGIRWLLGSPQKAPPASARARCGGRSPGLQSSAGQGAERELSVPGSSHSPGVPVLSHGLTATGAGCHRATNCPQGAHVLIPGTCECYFTRQKGLGQCDGQSIQGPHRGTVALGSREASLLVLKMGDGATAQGVQVAFRNWARQGNGFSSRVSRRKAVLPTS